LSTLCRVTAQSDVVAVVGAGASPLVAELVALDRNVIAVDVSAAAIDVLRGQLGDDPRVRFSVADARSVVFDEPVAAWHDRAVFHFLTKPEDQAAYASAASNAVRPGGHLVIATFAPGGPTMCSGLPTVQHDAASLSAVFAPSFELVEATELDHLTPWSASQRFTHAVFRRCA
jgi:SAM-dependent methyltransferase